MDKTLTIATDYTRYPGPRYEADGPYSGEVFRDTILASELQDAIDSDSVLTVVLDGVAGYGSSFLEESFGGLLRRGFTQADIQRHLRVVAMTPRFAHHARTVARYISDAALAAA